MMLSASLVREETGETFLVLRLGGSDHSAEPPDARSASSLERLVEAMPDAFVATDAQGTIQATNSAFLALTQIAHADQAVGKSLDRWVGRSPVDVDVLLKNLRDHGTVRRFNSVIRGEFGAVEDIEIAAVSAIASTTPTIGFVIRAKAPRDVDQRGAATSALTRSVDQMTELVGRVPLKDLVRETTDIIERICIEAALQLTKDNRASAAEMLGLSRQGLYIKLRRYGIGDDADGDETA
jgi:transcriptional regulator PpsR